MSKKHNRTSAKPTVAPPKRSKLAIRISRTAESVLLSLLVGFIMYLFIVGFVSVYGRTVSPFVAFDMVLSIFENLKSLSYRSVNICIIGVLYFLFSILNARALVACVSRSVNIAKDKMDRGVDSNALIERIYYLSLYCIVRLLAFIAICAAIDRTEIDDLAKFAVMVGIVLLTIVIFVEDVLAKEKITNGLRKAVFSLISLCSFLIVFQQLLLPVLWNTVNGAQMMRYVNWSGEGKSIALTVYGVLVDYALLLLLTIVMLCAVSSFLPCMRIKESTTVKKRLGFTKNMFCISAVIFVLRGVINVYCTENANLEFSQEMIKTFYDLNKDDIIPFLLLLVSSFICIQAGRLTKKR